VTEPPPKVSPHSFCVGPFVEVRINPDGAMSFCHAADFADLPESENISRYTVDEYFSASTAPVDAYRNRLLDGQSLTACHKCYKDEHDGVLSFRQRHNLRAAIFPGDDFAPSVQEVLPRVLSWKKPRFYHVSLSNLCNMACMMCDPKHSSLLATMYQKHQMIPRDRPVLQDWTQDERVWQNFVQHLLSNPDILCLHLMGGEPMYHKKFLELLDVLIAHDHRDFVLSIVTNGSVFDQAVLQRLRQFREVIIEISIESLDASNDYIRYPSRYQHIQKNIEHYLAQRDAQFSVVLRSVPQLLSVLNYDRLLDFARQHHILIDSNILHRPAYMHMSLLPKDIKTLVIDRLSKFTTAHKDSIDDANIRDITDLDRRLSAHARTIINQLQQYPSDGQQQLRQLIAHCQKLDRARNITVKDYVPELVDFFHENGYDDTGTNQD